MFIAFPSFLRNSQTGRPDESPEELTKNGLKGPSLVIWIQVWVGAQDVLCPSGKHFRRLGGLGKLEKPGCGAHLYQGPCYRDVNTQETGLSDLCPKHAFLGQAGKGKKTISQAPLQLWFKS